MYKGFDLFIDGTWIKGTNTKPKSRIVGINSFDPPALKSLFGETGCSDPGCRDGSEGKGGCLDAKPAQIVF